MSPRSFPGALPQAGLSGPFGAGIRPARTEVGGVEREVSKGETRFFIAALSSAVPGIVGSIALAGLSSDSSMGSDDVGLEPTVQCTQPWI